MRRSIAPSPYLVGRFPHGIARRKDLLALGVAQSTITRRCRPGGPWRTALLGQVKMGSGPLTQAERMYVTAVHAGAGAMYTGVIGARLHGVARLPTDPRIHMLIPEDRHVSSRDFALLTRTSRMPDPVLINGRPVAPAARCIVDAATRMDDVDAVRAMMADAVQKELCSIEALRDELAEPRRPGTALARRVFGEIDTGARSAAEAWALDVVRRSGLPSPQWNVKITTRDGRVLGIVDAYWEEVGLALEVQSRAFHLSPTSQVNDTRKAAALAAVGVRLVPMMAVDARERRKGTIALLRDAYAHAGPRPDVVATLHRPV